MKPAGLFLGKFQNLEPADAGFKRALINVVAARAGVTLTPNQIVVVRRAVYLKIPAAGRSQIFLKREQINRELARQIF